MKSWFSRVRTRLSFANVVSTVALFLALGGTSYAAAQLPFNSVGKGQIIGLVDDRLVASGDDPTAVACQTLEHAGLEEAAAEP